MVDWSDPQTFWLNVTNAMLGAVTLVALALVFVAVLADVYERVKQRVLAVLRAEPHALVVPGLGVTMADGGEPEKKKDEKAS